jgi:hypothetical protein
MPAGTAPAQQGTAASPAPASVAAVPFNQASHHGCEQGPTFVVTPGAAQQTFGPFPLPATGYLRRVILSVTTTTAGVAGTGAGDYPWNIFALLRLTDTNGAPIFELSGYNTLLADVYGSYTGVPDPRTDPDYSASATAPSIEPFIAPPFAGTIQLWSQQPNVGVNAGANRIALNRMGNLLRSVLVVLRSAGARSDAIIGDPVTLRWDDINLDVVDRKTIRKRMREYTNDLVARDTGVYWFGIYNYGADMLSGGPAVASWLPTVTATRYEISTPAGSGTAGTLDWVVNDVSVAAQSPEQRAAVGGAGVGFHPPVAPVVPGAV